MDTNGRPGAWTTETNAYTSPDSPGLQLFTVAGKAPQLLKPASGAKVANDAVLFEWAPVAGASRYLVEVSRDGFATVLQSATTDMAAWAPALATKWASGSYAWRVTTLDSAGAALATSSAQSFQVLTAPAAPTSVVATAGAAQAVVTWTAPTSDGGSPITGYRVTSTPGAVTATTSGQTHDDRHGADERHRVHVLRRGHQRAR